MQTDETRNLYRVSDLGPNGQIFKYHVISESMEKVLSTIRADKVGKFDEIEPLTIEFVQKHILETGDIITPHLRLEGKNGS